MAQLRQGYQEFRQRSAEIIVVGPEGPKSFSHYWEKNGLPFIGLPDPEHRVLKLFGQEVRLFKLGRLPAQVVIDRQGVARYAHYGKSMADIPPNEEILGILDHLEEETSNPG